MNSFFNIQQRANGSSGTSGSSAEERRLRMPWVEKYRPKKLTDVSSQDHAVTVLKKALTNKDANLPHMLFYGPPGTGKTSTILALAKQLYGPELYKSRVLELNASDERGISIVREKVKNFAKMTLTNPSKKDLELYPCPPYKIIVLDEADSMTNDAQSALRRTMELYSNVTRFCLICNYITRIIDPLASRCSKFRFKPLDSGNAIARLEYICEVESVKYEPGVLEEIIKISDGDLRKAITFLQSATKLVKTMPAVDDDGDVEVGENSDENIITLAAVRDIAGIVPDNVITNIVNVAQQHTFNRILELSQDLYADGFSATQIIGQLHDFLIHDESVPNKQKIEAALVLNETDMRLANGTDESLQVLNLMCKLEKVL